MMLLAAIRGPERNQLAGFCALKRHSRTRDEFQIPRSFSLKGKNVFRIDLQYLSFA